jgi:arabinofuranosyltransferase
MIAATQERQWSAGDIAAALRWSPDSARARAFMLLALCIFAVSAVIVLFQVPYRHTVRIGEVSASGQPIVRGFYDPEGKGGFTYRWTTDHAIVLLPQGVFPGEVDVVLSGDRPGSKPPRVAFAIELVGEAPLADMQSTADFAVYRVRLPRIGGSLNPSEVPGLVITPSDTVTPPKDNRDLGVAVEQIVVFTNPLRFGPVVPPILPLLLALGMAAALGLMALSVSPPLGQFVIVAYGPVALTAVYLALLRTEDPGRQAHAVFGFTVAALVALVFVWHQPLRARPWVRRLAVVDGRWLLALAMLVSLGYALYASHQLFGRLYDDTHISLRYAQNLADGHGLRFNPGERPVEGYTNFLLTVLLAACIKVGLPIVTMAKIISIGAAVGVVAVTYWLTTLVLPEASGLLRATPSLMLAGCGWYAYYAAIGLETHLFALLVVVAVCLLLRRQWPWAGLIFTGAYLTRPEGAGLWAVTLAWLVWQAVAPAVVPYFPRVLRRDGGATGFAPPRPREIAAFALPFVLLAGAHEIWRLSYYGEPVPNTFYDKVGTATQQVKRGIDYVTHSLPQLHPFVLVTLILFLALIPSVAIWNAAARYLALLVVAFVGYIVLVGGDFIGPRFLFHVFPLLIVLAVAGVRSLLRSYPIRRGSAPGDAQGWAEERASALAAFSVALIAFWLFLPLVPPNTFMKQRVANTHMRVVTGLTALGDYLRDTAPPDATLAIDAAGVVPFISRLPTLDMLGLSDYHIAHTVKATGDGLPGHEKTDPDYILAQRPTYIAVGMSKVTSGGRPGRGLDRPGFDALYTRVALVQMTESRVSPNLVLVLKPDTDVQAAIDAGFTYALYKLR